jgi:hypothetical protein
MKVKINDKWFEGKFNDKGKFIIPLYGEVDIKFFYKWGKKHSDKPCFAESIEYRKICDSGILHNCYPILNLNEDEVMLIFDSYKIKEVHE